MQIANLGVNFSPSMSAKKSELPAKLQMTQAPQQNEVCSKNASSAYRSMAFANMAMAKKPAVVPFTSMETIKKANHYKEVFNEAIAFDKESGTPLIKEVKDGFIDKISKKMAEHPEKPIMIAITGESACGKSTFAKQVEDFAKASDIGISMVTTDNYFKDLTKEIEKHGSYANVIKSGYDVDSPNNFYLDDLKRNISDLADGKDTLGRKYSMDGTSKSFADAVPLKANKIVFVEGTAAMLDGIGELFDAKIYVDLDEQIRKERSLKRAPERGHSPEEALVQWEYVKEAGKKYVRPLKDKCELVIDGEFNFKHISNLLGKLSGLKETSKENLPKAA